LAECIACGLLTGRIPLPGGRIHATPHWMVHHVAGPFGLGALAVVPLRHVVGTADLTDGEAAELGGLLRTVARVVRDLTDPVQVYTCQWSHHGGKAAHVHFICQPIRRADMDRHPGQLGPMLQAAMFESQAAQPDDRSVEAFAERARNTFTVAEGA
jgi:diadenosine tetraphosphate (Ap4A) HIT family hydrolase